MDQLEEIAAIGFNFEEIITAVTKNFVYVLLIYQKKLMEKIEVIVTVGHFRQIVAEMNFMEIVNSMNFDLLVSSKEIVAVIAKVKELHQSLVAVYFKEITAIPMR